MKDWADEIAKEHWRVFIQEQCCPPDSYAASFRSFINLRFASALRKARSDALEEAAKYMDQVAYAIQHAPAPRDMNEVESAIVREFIYAADAIRSLKDKQP